MLNNTFIELIQVSLGLRKCLSYQPSVQEWRKLFDMASRHSIVGVTFNSLQKLKQQNLSPPIEVLMEWYGLTSKIRLWNADINRKCVEVQQKLLQAGMKSTILKGQGIGIFYDKMAEYRSPGDIDVWVDGTWKQVMDYVNSLTPNREFDGKHTHLNVYRDTSVEIHWWPSVSANPFLSKRLRKFYRDQIIRQCSNRAAISVNGESHEIMATDAFFDSIHALLHIFGHFVYEGINLKQVMDYYFVLKQFEVQERKSEIVKYYKQFGIYAFAMQMMYVLQDVFSLPDDLLLVPVDSVKGKVLLHEIMVGGDYVKHDVKVTKRILVRIKRKLRLLRFNFIGIVFLPFYKLQLAVWKHYIFKKYDL